MGAPLPVVTAIRVVCVGVLHHRCHITVQAYAGNRGLLAPLSVAHGFRPDDIFCKRTECRRRLLQGFHCPSRVERTRSCWVARSKAKWLALHNSWVVEMVKKRTLSCQERIPRHMGNRLVYGKGTKGCGKRGIHERKIRLEQQKTLPNRNPEIQ